MLNFRLHKKTDDPFALLVLGAHSDDIEIGCGGTILKLMDKYKNIKITWVVMAAQEKREREAKKSTRNYLKNIHNYKIITHQFRDGFLPYQGGAIKKLFEVLKTKVSPDLILTHFRDDLHQDHRIISELTWNTFRNHTILEYEIPKYDGDIGSPNLFVPLEEAICIKKIKYLLGTFKTQAKKQWFTEETFWAILRLRGIESNSPTKYAEAFYARKVILE